MSRCGDGLFEPALGRLIALWGFHSDEFKPVLPDPRRWRDPRPPSAHRRARDRRPGELQQPAVELDLGGYAKGYALDRAAAILRAEGIANALINIGGNVMALGRKGDQPWRVPGIQHPRAGPAWRRWRSTMAVRRSAPRATTSAISRSADGAYSHLLDPRTGAPADATRR